MHSSIADQLFRELEDGTVQITVPYRLPRKAVRRVRLSIYRDEIVLVEEDRPTTKVPVVEVEGAA